MKKIILITISSLLIIGCTRFETKSQLIEEIKLRYPLHYAEEIETDVCLWKFYLHDTINDNMVIAHANRNHIEFIDVNMGYKKIRDTLNKELERSEALRQLDLENYVGLVKNYAEKRNIIMNW